MLRNQSGFHVVVAVPAKPPSVKDAALEIDETNAAQTQLP